MKRYLKFTPILLLLIAIDLVSKELISASLSRGADSVPLIPGFFQLTLVHNTGAAFGIGHRWSLIFFVVISFVALGVIGYLFHRLKEHELLPMWALVLIMSGAVGNLVDRLRFGYVVDFFDAYVGRHHWPAFNVADAAITIGAVLFALDMILPKKKGA